VVVTLVVAAVGSGAAAPGCGGPLDSRPPRMTVHPDAGTDVRRTVDAARDLGTRPDAVVIVDTGASIPWPIIPGCVSGLPPAPRFTPSAIPPVTISCAASSPVLLQVSDAAAHGMLFVTTLDPPVSGIYSTISSTVCATNGTSYPAAVQLFVGQGASLPGHTINTTLRITPMGPAQSGYAFPLTINTVPIDFTVNPAVADFGNVTQGAYTQMTLMVSNALDSAPFESLYWTQPPQGLFSLLPNGLPGPSLLPGDSQPMLRAIMTALTAGTAETTFLVSPFAPGVPIDPSCGVIRTITMRAQITPTGLPPLPPIPGP
jgi:hypothetical protein